MRDLIFRIIVVFCLFIINAGMISAGQVDLDRLLKGTIKYCERLEKEAFHFFCNERIVESEQRKLVFQRNNTLMRKFLNGNRYSNMERLNGREPLRGRFAKNILINDYQIIKDEKGVRERRKVLKDSRKIKRNNDSTVIYSYKAVLTPIMLFSKVSQSLYCYKKGKVSKVMGRKAVEIIVSNKNKSNPLVCAWIDIKDYSVIKFRVYPGAIKGYSNIIHVNRKTMKNVVVEDVHYFGYKRNGVRYPTRTRINISYEKNAKKGEVALLKGKIYSKVQTEISYNDYRFFNTAADDPVFRDLPVK